MQPYTDPVLELRLVVKRAEQLAAAAPAGATHPQFEDIRTQVQGDLMEALNRVDRGLGTRLLLAMYPRAGAALCQGERRAA